MAQLLAALGIGATEALAWAGVSAGAGYLIDTFSSSAPTDTTSGTTPTDTTALLQEIAAGQRKILLHWGMSEDAYRQLVDGV